ncbi:hypothetical protein OS493_035813 [Desmophyllum pertusum]|uniref:C2 domain-containing protein n=1 Tax=Desmophyllum pertusum TaxID=174260 RepID=A0A9W9Y7K8_9CNID|nr:hypothetical protein OS493_035813 [Desmophyllum pertusum]
MAEELKKKVKVMMKTTDDDAEWIWDMNKFVNRTYLMKEMFQNYYEGEEDWDVPEEQDPFWEPHDAEIDVEEILVIKDYKDNEKGHLQSNYSKALFVGRLKRFPCSEEMNDDFKDPKELIGKALYLKLKIPSASGLPAIFGKGETFCKYKLYLDDDYNCTKRVSGNTNPSYDFEKKYTFKPVTEQFVEYLLQTPLVIEVWGKQSGRKISREEIAGAGEINRKKMSVGPASSGMPNNGQVMSKDEGDRSEKKIIATVEDILNGVEGNKFNATAGIVIHVQKSPDKDGKINSGICLIL